MTYMRKLDFGILLRSTSSIHGVMRFFASPQAPTIGALRKRSGNLNSYLVNKTMLNLHNG